MGRRKQKQAPLSAAQYEAARDGWDATIKSLGESYRRARRACDDAVTAEVYEMYRYFLALERQWLARHPAPND